MIILGPRPAKRPLGPACLARTTRRWTIEPSGPWPLLICDSRVSAGCSQHSCIRGPATYLRENGSSETSDDTRGKGDAELLRLGEVLAGLLAHGVVNCLRGTLVDGELADGVGDLLAENGDEAGVETAETLGAEDLGEARPETVGVLHSVSGTVPSRAQTWGFDTRRIRVASAGVRRMSAKNLRHVRSHHHGVLPLTRRSPHLQGRSRCGASRPPRTSHRHRQGTSSACASAGPCVVMCCSVLTAASYPANLAPPWSLFRQLFYTSTNFCSVFCSAFRSSNCFCTHR